MSNLSVLVYRLYFIPKSAMRRIVDRWPLLNRPLSAVKSIVRRYVLPKTRTWLQVQKGFTQGMCMRLNLPDDARYWRGEHEPEVGLALLAAIQPGDVVYDVGTHLGYFALGAARIVGQSGLVIAFDGDPDNIARVRENAAKNGLGERLQVCHAAVWSRTEPDKISFRRGVEPRAQGGVEADGCRPVLGNAELIEVPGITLDAFIARGAPCPHLVKIDVEGGEYEVLSGAGQLFSRHRPLLIAEVHHNQAFKQIGRWLEQHRYCAAWTEGDGPRQLRAWPAEYDGAAWSRRIETESAGIRSS
jgi:FkbM family methyltransferase